MYNCTPHASTGFTPYYLFFGHDPRLPIDNLLSTPRDRARDADLWVQLHHHRMQDAIKRASNKMSLKASERKRRHDRRAKIPKLPIGTNVLTRNRVLGRNKIQDIWNPTLHTVVGQLPNDSSAILVSRSTDGKSRVINRVDLLPFSDSSDKDDVENQRPNTPVVDSDSESSSSDGMMIWERVDPIQPTQPPEKDVRRSARSTKGTHSNPHHLPKSVLKQECTASKYTDYSDAILQLGQMSVGQIHDLGKLLEHGYCKPMS